jgi:DHA1 family bicyclomycin/chloramphenicol resistance-like MFS transporter
MAGRSVVMVSILLMAAGQLGISMYTPSLPPMAAAFDVDSAAMQATLTAYLLAFGGGQLVLGPLTQAHGRKRVLHASLGMLAAGSLICAASDGLTLLIGARVLQGLGAGGASAVARVLLRDRHDGEDLKVAASQVSMGIVIVPLIAPVFGGYMELYFGWRAQFLAVAVFAIALYPMVRRFREGPHEDAKESLRWAQVAGDYGRLLGDREFLGHVGCAAAVYGCTTAYYITAPFLLQDGFGLKPHEYGWVPVATVASYVAGTCVNIAVTRRLKRVDPFVAGMSVMLLGGLSMMWVAAVLPGAHGIVAAMCLVMLGQGLVLPSAIARALSTRLAAPGYAAALLGAAQMGGSGLVGIVAAGLCGQSPLRLGGLLLVLTVLCAASSTFCRCPPARPLPRSTT